MHRFQKVKKLLDLTVFFALLGSGRVKAARKMLAKLTHGLQYDIFLPCDEAVIAENKNQFENSFRENCREPNVAIASVRLNCF